MQVADRWHLVKNAREVAERVLQRRSTSVRTLLSSGEGQALRDEPTANSTDTAGRLPAAITGPKWERRLARFEQVRQMHREGISLRGIQRALKMNYQTVQRYVRSEACPDWQPGRRRPSVVDGFEHHIRRRLAEGCHNGRQILRELHDMGFRGGKTVVQQRIRRLKEEAGLVPPRASDPTSRASAVLPSFRQLAVAIIRRPANRDDEIQQALAALCAGDAIIKAAAEAIEDFVKLIRERRPHDLSSWLVRARSWLVSEVRAFAERLSQDEAAVRSGIALAWSNGPVEGHVNRLKVIKRAMFGRARFDLLRARILAAG